MQTQKTSKIDSKIDNVGSNGAEDRLKLLGIKVPTRRESRSLYWRFRDAGYSHLAAILAVHALHNDKLDTLAMAKKADKQFDQHVQQYRDGFEFLASNIPSESDLRGDDEDDSFDDFSEDSTVPRQ